MKFVEVRILILRGGATVLVRDRHRDGEIVDEFDSEESGRCGGAGHEHFGADSKARDVGSSGTQ